ncbi:MAG: phenylacetate--CoA ligase family protein [Akkermansia sp.]|nr:phenylacetate--CoA ligase family protein [Akkermansia sp.]
MKAFFLRTLFWVTDFFKGSPIRKEYRQIRAVMNGERETNEELDNLLKYATLNCAYYSHLKGKKIQDFPVINKQIIRHNIDSFKIPEEKNPWQKKDSAYHIQKTSGSTGAPFAIPQDTRKRAHRLAELKYFGEIIGFRSHDCLVQLRIWTRWHKKNSWQAFKENIIPYDCSNLSDQHLEALCNIVHQKKALCMRAYASTFALLGRYLLRQNKSLPSVKTMIAGSEALLDSTRHNIRKACPNCTLISQYANEEAGILAQEEPGVEGIFQLNHAGYFFESIKLDSDNPAEEGEIGRLVITDLFNYACPLIRYDTGDMCRIKTDYKTGRKYIDKLYGRRLDMVFNTIGEPIFPMYFARILKNFDSIEQWQFIQNSKTDYMLKLTIDNDLNTFKASENEIRLQIISILGEDANLELVYVDEIPVLNSGKRKSVVNNCNL